MFFCRQLCQSAIGFSKRAPRGYLMAAGLQPCELVLLSLLPQKRPGRGGRLAPFALGRPSLNPVQPVESVEPVCHVVDFPSQAYSLHFEPCTVSFLQGDSEILPIQLCFFACFCDLCASLCPTAAFLRVKKPSSRLTSACSRPPLSKDSQVAMACWRFSSSRRYVEASSGA